MNLIDKHINLCFINAMKLLNNFKNDCQILYFLLYSVRKYKRKALLIAK